MKTSLRIFAFGIFSFLLTTATTSSTEPTLARLGFWVPPERMTEFETAYQKRVIPILKQHKMIASSEHSRTTIDSVFARLFTFKTPAEFYTKRTALLSDNPAFQKIQKNLGTTFGTTDTRGHIRLSFDIYQSPMGPGTRVPAGSGQGHWKTYDVSDGLAGMNIVSIFQDREGHIWFGTFGSGGGVSRFDGSTFTNFTKKDGLAGSNVFAIAQDHDGALWFSCDGGISRYDGKTFTNFTPKDGLVTAPGARNIFQDREGRLWFMTRNGVSRYNGKDSSTNSGKIFTAFTTENGLAHNDVRQMYQDRQGMIWLATARGGVSRYDGQSFTTFNTKNGLAHNNVTSILEDPEGVLYFGTYGGGVSRYDGQTWTTLTSKDGLADNRVSVLIHDHKGALWIGTAGGLSRYEGNTFTTFTTKEGLPHNSIRRILVDREGALWIHATDQGITRYDGQTFTNFNSEKGFPNFRIPSFLLDRDGILWFGTATSGVRRYDGQTFITFTSKDGLAHDVVPSIFEDQKGTLWFGAYTRSGVTRYDGQTFTKFTTEDGLIDNSVISTVQDQAGTYWFATHNGVSRYDGKTLTSFTTQDGLAHDHMRFAFLDREGAIWFCTGRNGVSRYNPSPEAGTPLFTNFTTNEGLIHNVVTHMNQDRDGVYWFGTDRGVSRYDGKTFTNFTPEDGLAGRVIHSVTLDGKDIWFSGGGGITRYDGKTFTTFTVEDGLTYNTIYGSFLDRDGVLWFGTYGGGVSRYDGQTFTTLTRQDGLAHNSVWPTFQDRKGTFWFGTMGGGVTRYRPPAPTPPPVFIDGIIADRHYQNTTDITFPSTVETTIFEFHGRSFKTRPEAMVYKYRLTGHEKNWQTTRDRRIEYHNLPRGTYIFEVQAVDRDLVYSTTPATVNLTVHLPYERIGWMSALSIAIVLVGWQTVRVIRRDRRLQESNHALSDANKDLFNANVEIQQQTERKSAFLASMSHELRTPITSMKGYADNILDGIGGQPNERHERYLKRVTENASHLLSLVNDLLDLSKVQAGKMEVDITSFSIKHLIDTCCGTVEPLLQPGVSLVQEVADNADQVNTDEGKLRHIVGNLLSNAVKFTEAGEIAVHVKKENEQLMITVSDTGIGMPQEALDTIFDEFQQVEGSEQTQKGTGLGLAISKQYTELLSGTISVASQVGKGTTFTIQIPIHQTTLD